MADSDPFDPYYIWLGIPPEEQPADYYRLLGVRRFETNADVIESAAHRQIAHVRSYSLGPHGPLSQKILNELARAKVGLLDPKRRADYDARLKSKSKSPAADSAAVRTRNVRTQPENSLPAETQAPPASREKKPEKKAAKQKPEKPASQKPDSKKHNAATKTLAKAKPVQAKVEQQQPTTNQELQDTGRENTATKSTTKLAPVPLVGTARTARSTKPAILEQIKRPLVWGPAAGLVVVLLLVMAISGGNDDPPDDLVDPLPTAAGNGTNGNFDTPLTDSDGGSTPTLVASITPEDAVARGQLLTTGPAIFDNMHPRTAEEAQAAQERWARFLQQQVVEQNSIGMDLVIIPPGKYVMGPPEGLEHALQADLPRVNVTLTLPFRMGKTEVSKAQWKQVMQTEPWLHYPKHGPDDTAAASFVNWFDVQEFCKELTKLDQAAGVLPEGWEYHLPTEAQWEFACRAGTTSLFNHGGGISTLDHFAWGYVSQWGAFPHPVGKKLPNAFGLHDMMGNVTEWCEDANIDGRDVQMRPGGLNPVVTEGRTRIQRGGHYGTRLDEFHSFIRMTRDPEKGRGVPHGFRVALVPTFASFVKPGQAFVEQSPEVPSPVHTHVAQGALPAILDGTQPRTAAEAQAAQHEWATYLGKHVVETNGAGMEMVLIPPGKFMMGAAADDKLALDNEKPQLEVTLTQPFCIGKTELTQAQWHKVLPNFDPWERPGQKTIQGDDFPATGLCWPYVFDFCQELTRQERAAGKLPEDWEYRWPTEAEWEFACRAGSTTPYYFGSDATKLSEHASHFPKEPWQLRVVGLKKPNPFGLYDLYGNVAEWCADFASLDRVGGADPVVASWDRITRSYPHMLRGGDWYSGAECLRSSYREESYAMNRALSIGVRVVAAPVSPAALPPEAAQLAAQLREAYQPPEPEPVVPPQPKPRAQLPAILDATVSRTPAEVQKAQQAWAQALSKPVVEKNSVGIDLVVIPPGRYLMGNSADPKQQREVFITRPFRIAATETTHGQWEALMPRAPWDNIDTERKEGKNFPARKVFRQAVLEFCERLTASERADGKLSQHWEYRLPTEAEWEFACRAGTNHLYYVSDEVATLREYAWWRDSSPARKPSDVAQLRSNAFGLYDMLGNVEEICLDRYIPTPPGGMNPLVTESDSPLYVTRGGCHDWFADQVYTHTRATFSPESEFPNEGFRVVLAQVTDAGYPAEFDVAATPQVTPPVKPDPQPQQPTQTPVPAPTPDLAALKLAASNWPDDPRFFDATRSRTAAEAQAAQQTWAQALNREVVETNGIGLDLVLIPPGKFLSGNPDPSGHASHRPQQLVLLSEPFYLGKTEVTQAEWQTVMNNTPWMGKDGVKEAPACAASHVDRNDALTFCRRLTDRELVGGRIEQGWEYRLPTQSEWEYAARSGTQTRFYFGDDPSQLHLYAWWMHAVGNTALKERYPHEVGEKLPNAFGLYDMLGNVTEWMQDHQQPFVPGGLNPVVWREGRDYVIRGGDWAHVSTLCDVWHRVSVSDTRKDSHTGFRVVLAKALDPVQEFTTWPNLKLPDVPPLDITQRDHTPEEVQASQQAWATALNAEVVETNTVGMKLTLVPPGKFTPSKYDVTLSRPYYVGVTEVTQAQWEAVMGTRLWEGSARIKKGANYPAGNICWDDAMEFCRRLSIRENKTYRLPTDAQWEFACRAGTKGPTYYGGDREEMLNHAWVSANCKTAGEDYAHEVAQKLPNPLGLFDLYGNASEWCLDSNDKRPEEHTIDPFVVNGSQTRRIRGGTYQMPSVGSGASQASYANWRGEAFGFRVVRIIE